MKRVEGKVAAVTGGAVGIGRATCLRLAEEGAAVAVLDVADREAEQVAAEIRARGGRVRAWHFDVTREGMVRDTLAGVVAEFRRLDVLVNNAGIWGANKPTHELTEVEWDAVQAVNVKGVFFSTKHAIPHLREAGSWSSTADIPRVDNSKEDVMNVLIGLDASPYSDAALEYVKRAAWPAGTRFIVASAVSVVPMAYSEAYVPAPAQTEEMLRDMTQFQGELVTKGALTLKDGGLAAEGRVLQGDARESLLELARKEKVDLIVVGSHGRTGLGKLVMGSVASHIVTHAPCSVLVVRSGEALERARRG